VFAMVKVSIIVPVYNVEQYLDRCLESLTSQTLKEIEIIVVNDGSPDNSQEIIDRYAKKFPKKIIALVKKNGGLSDARNYGMKYATGEYIGFVDSDDYVDINMYKTMYKKAKENNSDLVECDFYWVYNDKKIKDKNVRYDLTNMMIHVRVAAWNKIYKREIIQRENIEFPLGLRYEDIEFQYKLLPYLSRIDFVDEAFVYYIQRDGSIANTQNERVREIYAILNNVVDFYNEKNLYTAYQDQLEYIYIKYILGSSYLRTIQIRDKNLRFKILKEGWDILVDRYPNWKKNSYLNSLPGMKHRYYRNLNYFLYKKMSYIFRIIKR
jgi:glycosyltransferase involved in cell wall biosynthesis